MRIHSVLLAALSAVVLTGSLAACSGGAGSTGSAVPAPPVTSSPATSSQVTSSAASSAAVASPPATDTAIALVGTRWRVEGASGTTVRFDGLAITVADGDRSSSYAWSAQGSDILVGQSSSSLAGAVPAPWLTSATTARRTGTGWTLLDSSGATTAQLTPDGSAAATTATTLLTTATPGSGVVDLPASAIAGTWAVAGDTRSTITFADGSWHAASSCTTGAVGGQGVYRVLPEGRLLVTRTMTPIRGCPIVDGPVRLQPNAITAIARAASFRIQGGTLTLFDRSGVQLGSLTRA